MRAGEAPQFLITGANGFIGGHLTRYLAARGAGGWLLSRRSPAEIPQGFQWQSWEAGQPSRLPVEGDGACVVHLATVHHVDQPGTEALAQFEAVNVRGTAQLLADAAAAGIQRFIHFSSIKAAVPARGFKPQTEADLEADMPETPYGRSKRAAERLVTEWARAEARRAALILRPAVVYGPGNTANLYALVDMIARGRFFLAGCNDNVKSLVAVANVAAAVEFLAARMRAGVEMYYLVDRESYSVRQTAEMITAALGQPWRGRSLPLPLLRLVARAGKVFTAMTGRSFPLTPSRLAALVETSHFSASKLRAAGFQHPVDTREGLVEMVRWYQARR